MADSDTMDMHEIIVYSTPAKKVNQERKKERHHFYPMDIQSYTTTNKDRHTIKQHKIGHWMPSLENYRDMKTIETEHTKYHKGFTKHVHR